MAPSFRKALGAMKDRTSIGLVTVSGSVDPELDAAVIKATSHNDEPANERYFNLILTLTSYSKVYVSACAAAVSKRLEKTRDWVVALKILMLIHRLLVDGDPIFQHDILHATQRGTRLLNMADFYDKAHSDSWSHTVFVRAYAFYLDLGLRCSMYQNKADAGSIHQDGLTAVHPWKSLPASPLKFGDRHFNANASRSLSSKNEGRSSYSPSYTTGKAGDDEHQRWKDKKSAVSSRGMRQEVYPWKSLPASPLKFGDCDFKVNASRSLSSKNEGRSSYSPSSTTGKAGDDEHQRWKDKKSAVSSRGMRQEVHPWKSLPASPLKFGDRDLNVNASRSLSSKNESRSSCFPSSSTGKAGDDEHQRWKDKKSAVSLRGMRQEDVFDRMHELQQQLDRFLACRPTGKAENCKLILVAICPLVRESFQLYVDICEILGILLDRFFDMDYPDCVKTFDVYASAAKQIDELSDFYAWFKLTEVARPLEYPEVQRITGHLLETLEESMKDKARSLIRSPLREAVPLPINEEEDEDLSSSDSLSAGPSNRKEKELESSKVTAEDVMLQHQQQQKKNKQQQQLDLIDIYDESVITDDQSTKLDMALFKENYTVGNSSWMEAFPSSMGGSRVTSAWQSPISDIRTKNQDTMFMETIISGSNQQRNALDGEFSSLFLNGGMHDQWNSKLALPASGNTIQMIGPNPFVSSPLSIPSPPYLQMAEMERRQQMLIQEHIEWQQYAYGGMQGQPGYGNNNDAFIPNSPMSNGMPTSYNADPYYYHTP